MNMHDLSFQKSSKTTRTDSFAIQEIGSKPEENDHVSRSSSDMKNKGILASNNFRKIQFELRLRNVAIRL